MRIAKRSLVALAALMSGCGITTEPDCGLYDFSCQDNPQSAALIDATGATDVQPGVPASAPAVGGPSTSAPAPAAPARSLDARVRALEIQLDALTQRLDALDGQRREP